MDAVKRHLLFDDKLQQIQAVHALYKMTETKVGKMSVIGFQSTHQVPELEYLLNLCCHGDVAISQTAQQCMVSMLNQKLVDLEGCIKNTLKLVSTVPDLTSLLTFLVSLMELQMTSMGLNCPVHPLVKVYEITSADQWQQLAVAFSNSLFTINKLSSASQQECRWKELMTYHKVFLEALVSSTTDKCSGILSMAISTCISYHQYLDYTICTLIEILQQTQNIFSSNNVMVLEILWQAVGMQTPGERVCTLLVEFTLAVAVSSTISYNIWKLIDSRAIQMVAFPNVYSLD
ncbi:hypothetical protein EB796_002619 [Bugula neritina]|uniref:Uncharacterized protein n=1 Tax=Bugula neritina TaxID=10212 RepID=A0A7J7KL49_BUGNE|nr:hypothetical protein EB796_002619 [Bugula neritina]